MVRCTQLLTMLLVFGTAAIVAARAMGEDAAPKHSPRALELVGKWRTLSYALPGGYPSAPVQRPEVQKQLGLTAEQKSKIMEIGFEYNARLRQQNEDRLAYWNKPRGKSPEEQKKFEEENRARDRKGTEDARQWAWEARKQVEQLLQPKQLAQLKEIEFRDRVAKMYYSPQVFDRLELSAEQKQKVKAIRDETDRKLRELSEQIMQAQRDAASKSVDVLTPEQLERLKESTDPYAVPPGKPEK